MSDDLIFMPDESKISATHYLLSQDTFYVGYIKGVGRIYQQTVIGACSNFGFAKLYLDKSSLTSADVLNDKVLPLFDEQGMKVLRTLTDDGLEYCGRTDIHAYQLFLHLNDIEHTRTKVRHPQNNGSTEKLNQTIKNKFYAVAFRKKVYTTLEEIQIDLDDFMKRYNFKRTNQGKHRKGRTPGQTFDEAYDLYKKYVID